MGSGTREPGPLTRAVAAELRVAAARRNLTQKEIAATGNVPIGTLGKIFRGIAPIDIEQLAQICAGIGVDPRTVLGAALQQLDAEGEEEAAACATVIEGRFDRMGSSRAFSEQAVAHHSEVSIFDEQNEAGESP